jgi:hypothetical protein
VTDDVSGLLYDPYSAGALAAALQRLVDRPAEVARLAAGVPAVKGIECDAAEWEARYARVVSGAEAPA